MFNELFESEILTELNNNILITDKTIQYTQFAIFASLLSYFVIKQERKELVNQINNLDKVPLKDYFKIDFIVGIIVIICAFYYFKVSITELKETTTDDNINLCSNKMNYLTTFIVLIAAIIDFYNILFLKNNENT
ncbi:MAG: hypothetical protein RR290_02290 [Clostridia bacterium]